MQREVKGILQAQIASNQECDEGQSDPGHSNQRPKSQRGSDRGEGDQGRIEASLDCLAITIPICRIASGPVAAPSSSQRSSDPSSHLQRKIGSRAKRTKTLNAAIVELDVEAK